MSEIASKGQLRLAYLRWAVVTVPFILLLGLTSSRLAPTGSQSPWYMALSKPEMTPPDWVFPVAWSALYVLLGLALAMIINARGSKLRGPAIVLFAVHMAFNLAWSPVFFGMHQVVVAFGILVVMFLLALATTVVFGKIRTGAALLLLPYLGWLVFAGILNWQIHELNPNAETLVTSGGTTQIEL